MAGLIAGALKSVSVPVQDAALARESSDAFTNFVGSKHGRLTVRLLDQESGEQVEATVPSAALRMLAEALAEMAEGRSIAFVPLDTELSTQQAAGLLGVSRPYLIKLLEQGRMPFRKVGEQRRIRYRDLLDYVKTYQQEATAALNEAAGEDQRHGLYE
jgi:excisionase family DNA binding protein